MNPEAELELMQGTLAAMARDYPSAIAALERAAALDPLSADIQLNLFSTYELAGRDGDAEAMTGALLRDHPRDPGILTHIARRRSRQGRHDEALALIHSPFVDLSPSSMAFPTYLLILSAAARWEEASLATRGGLDRDAPWAPMARLARLLALLHFKEYELVRQELDAFDPDAYSALLEDWAGHLRAAGALDRVRASISDAAVALPDQPRLGRLAARL